MTIGVLIIDDSPTMRAILTALLESEPDITVLGAAANAAEGRAMIKQLDPDVVTLDVEMPGMNGLDFLQKIMDLRPTRVIMVSGSTQRGSEIAARALMIGAIDCYAKAARYSHEAPDDGGQLAGLIRAAMQVDVAHRPAAAQRTPLDAHKDERHDAQLIAIGSSTGGVEALREVLGRFSADCPPTLIVQHVSARFAPAIARTLDEVSAARVVLAEPGMRLQPGHVYFAPGDDRHMTVMGSTELRIELRAGKPVSGHLPSIDVLFDSVAALRSARAVGILLTGMGSDGAQGLLSIARSGGRTIAQDEASSVVFGMPRAAIALGAAQVVAPLAQVAHYALSEAA
jgi:two-component system chemotaxis response regulator CheB